MKKLMRLLVLCALCITLYGCSEETPVYVQSVEALMNMGGIAPGDRFAGLVVAEHIAEINKDSEKNIKELLVKQGDYVTEGQELFSYDTEQLQLALDKEKLELEQMHATIENYKSQIATLERERNSVGESAKLQYTIEIQSTQIDLKEAELNLTAKEAKVKQAEELLENAVVVSPITGRVQSINENGNDPNNYSGTPTAFITILQADSYRIKGILGELQLSGLTEGVPMTITSRTDSGLTWSGTVSKIDFENPTQGNDFDRYYGMGTDEMTAASKYPFYVQLDSTEGLMLGQHVYMELKAEETATTGPAISSAFICYNDDGSAYVWAEKRGKLEQRSITLGEYNPNNDTQEILSGLSEKDYIAFPDPELCKNGVPTTRDEILEDPVPMEGGVG